MIIEDESLTFYIRKEIGMLLPPDIGREELLLFVRPLYPNGIFPLGSGWRIVLCIVSALFSAGVLIYHTPRMKRRREAFAAFKTARRSFLSAGDISALAADLSFLIRRVAVCRFGREKTAALNAAEWGDFLNRTGADLNERDRQLLTMQAYAPRETDKDTESGQHLLRSVQKWLRRNL